MLVLITGTRSGIGKLLAEKFLERGHEVIGCSRRKGSIEHERYQHVLADVTAPADVRALCRLIRRDFGYLDALVNNAGTSVMNHFMMTPEEVSRKIFDVNFFAVLDCCRESSKLLQKSHVESPAIVNVSTVAVPWALEGQLVYSASKSAVDQLTRVMSKELGPFGIRVNGIGLPPVRTALTRTVPTEKIDALISRQAIKRMCTVDDIIGPLEFLVSSNSAFVTGETIFLGGVN